MELIKTFNVLLTYASDLQSALNLEFCHLRSQLQSGLYGFINGSELRINNSIPENHFLAFRENEEIPEDLSQLEPQKLFDYYS
jgi:hypothetical protein